MSAKYLSFRKIIAETIKNQDVISFQDEVKNHLKEIKNEEEVRLNEQYILTENLEVFTVASVLNNIKLYEGFDFAYDEGIISVTIPGKEAALSFSKMLDENDNIDSYIINALIEEENEKFSEEDELDIDSLEEDEDYDFDFMIFLKPDIVAFNSEEDNEEVNESNELNEVTVRKVFRFRKGRKIIKMTCPPGYKWNKQQRRCIKMQAQEMLKRHLLAIRNAIKRASRAAIASSHRRKTMTKRSSAGMPEYKRVFYGHQTASS